MFDFILDTDWCLGQVVRACIHEPKTKAKEKNKPANHVRSFMNDATLMLQLSCLLASCHFKPCFASNHLLGWLSILNRYLLCCSSGLLDSNNMQAQRPKSNKTKVTSSTKGSDALHAEAIDLIDSPGNELPSLATKRGKHLLYLRCQYMHNKLCCKGFFSAPDMVQLASALLLCLSDMCQGRPSS